eukprot:CAMPEP_0170440768 /NCGR_PEP_ID=MMETSP0117_2-20130122/46515_1 /TAXON_ID=400756 /ORGANISM="Durinskia baltica, Strain CSIRO CS-38" /LENGTH=39 /DNA_ID= /DNA_START= /DNA_END= /DNA_ORIENTATION=
MSRSACDSEGASGTWPRPAQGTPGKDPEILRMRRVRASG